MVAAAFSAKQTSSKRTGLQWPIDAGLAIPVFALFAVSLIMVFSASMNSQSLEQGPTLSVLMQQGIIMSLAIAIMLGASRLPLDLIQRMGPLLVIASLIVLALLLVPGVGVEVWGSVRWIRVGPVNLQPSEFAKVFLIIYIAGYLTRKKDNLARFSEGILTISIVLGAFGALLLLEPDFGSTVVIVATAFAMLFLGGIRWLHFTLIIGVAAMGAVLLISFASYRLARISAFMDPWADPMNKGYQLIQSYIAFGRGGWTGIGLGESIQKLNYLPAAKTDFLFAVISEELGFVGIVCVLGLFMALIWRAFELSRRAESAGNLFACRLAQGIALLIAIQVLINAGVNMGLLPTKGLTLPFISQGGSSLLASSLAMGLLFAVARETTPVAGRKKR
ncbi:MAG TPA: putative lipid II flippase FtsW [Gammaproteobacteria bacterium]|nr:putative lipid II flippase FtsW [Gammaproteobacteria bacterium]